MDRDLTPYVDAFESAMSSIRRISPRGARWWPRSQPEATALSWALGLGLTPRETRWVYSCWGSQPDLKAAVLEEHQVRHAGARSRNLPAERRGAGRLFYPRQYLVDFSTYPRSGNEMLLAMESEAWPDHQVGSSEIDPTHDYAWDFSKLLYLPARLRMFVARVRGSDRRSMLWTDLTSIVRGSSGAFHLESPIVVYVLPAESKGAGAVGIWQPRAGAFDRRDIGYLPT